METPEHSFTLLSKNISEDRGMRLTPVTQHVTTLVLILTTVVRVESLDTGFCMFFTEYRVHLEIDPDAGLVHQPHLVKNSEKIIFSKTTFSLLNWNIRQDNEI